MIRNVVVHLLGEQPIMADLLVAPKPIDVSVICSNIRTLAGKQPVFVDHSDSTFVIPLAHIRFMEIRAVAMEQHATDGEAEDAAEATVVGDAARAEGEALGLAMGRLDWTPVADDPQPAGAAEPDVAEKPDSDEIDPDLLRRVRDA
jgi:hypothetical protein